jgi:tetratricopeptide (TPR) repeat protein
MIRRAAIAAMLAAALCLTHPGAFAMDVSPFWNFDDPAGTEARLRGALATARGDDALVLRTQIARTLGLRSRFDEAHALLDAIEPQLPGAGAEPRVRLLLERGRTWRSSGQPARARPLFAQAVPIAQAAALDALAIDAMHMVALVEPDPQAQLDWNRRALAAAQTATDPAARDWDASLANNIGMTLHAQGRFEEALESFRAQLAARERIGKPGGVRIARWMIAWTLRSLRRHDEALALLRSLEREFAAIGEADGYVHEEIGENLLAQGDAGAARPEFARAHALLSADTSLGRPDATHLARLLALSKAP